MCLGVPGKVTEVHRFDGLDIVGGKVDFGGVSREVNLSFTPEAEVGDYVMVHVGFAISIIDEEEAATTLEYLQQLAEEPDDEPSPRRRAMDR
jgi:hydrogenase expression/formation protein HypC